MTQPLYPINMAA